jgi:lipopolysaccharide export system permease protein
MVVLYKKYSVPVSAFILTIIAVSVSYKKRRRYGMNLLLVLLLLLRVFDKIFGTLAENLLFTIVGSMVLNIILNISNLFTRNAKR